MKYLERHYMFLGQSELLREKMSAESLKLAKGKFSLKAVTKQMGEIYRV